MSNYREKRHELIDQCILLLVRLDRRKDISLERIPLIDLQELEIELKNFLDQADEAGRYSHETYISENDEAHTPTKQEESEDLRNSETLKDSVRGRLG